MSQGGQPIIQSVPITCCYGYRIVIEGEFFGNEEGLVIFEPGVNGLVVRWVSNQVVVLVPSDSVSGHLYLIRADDEEESNKVEISIQAAPEDSVIEVFGPEKVVRWRSQW